MTILNGSFRITPETRINAEPAPTTTPGDFGVRLVGNAGQAPKQIDIDRKCSGFDEAHKRGYLTAKEAEELKAQVRRLNGSTGVHTNAAGVTTMFDANDARRTCADIAARAKVGEDMNRAASEFWSGRGK